MNSDSFFLTNNTYPENAKGWIDGVFYPRVEKVVSLKNNSLKKEGDAYSISSRVWTETEETGWGVYSYEDTTAINYNLENANYEVTLALTNPTTSSYKVDIKANNIKKINNIRIDPQENKEVTFTICIINGLLSMKILPVDEATSKEMAKFEKVYIKDIYLKKLASKKPGKKPVIYLASDSTVQTYSKSFAPQTGWGEVLIKNFQKEKSENVLNPRPKVYETDDIIIENHAIGGRSSKSFLEEGRLDDILKDVKENDYVFVQFGHNDATKARPNRYVSSKEFRKYIQSYIDGVKQRKGICVLVTPVARRNCNEETGEFSISFNNYRRVMQMISEEQKIPLLDLGKESTAYLNSIGPEESKKLFLWVKAGEYPESQYAKGVEDNTHLQRKGAIIFANILARLIKEYDQDDKLDPLKEFIYL